MNIGQTHKLEAILERIGIKMVDRGMSEEDAKEILSDVLRSFESVMRNNHNIVGCGEFFIMTGE